MYHYVEDSVPNSTLRADLQVQGENFKQQLDYLKNNGYTAVKMEDLFLAFYYGKTLPQKPVIITFDDGYEDAYKIAFPILKEKEMTAIFFVITGLLDTPNYLTREEVKEMDNKGMEIGSHSQTHPDLSIAPSDKAKSEIEESKKDLEELLNKKIYFFCYPSGKYNAETGVILKNAGYLMAVNTLFGNIHLSDRPFDITRVRIHGQEPFEKFRENLDK